MDCEVAQRMIVEQMKEWENNPCPEPVDGKPNGQKCNYKVIKQLILHYYRLLEITTNKNYKIAHFLCNF